MFPYNNVKQCLWSIRFQKYEQNYSWDIFTQIYGVAHWLLESVMLFKCPTKSDTSSALNP